MKKRLVSTLALTLVVGAVTSSIAYANRTGTATGSGIKANIASAIAFANAASDCSAYGGEKSATLVGDVNSGGVWVATVNYVCNK